MVDDTILCHDYIDQDSPVRGYKWLKPSSNGIWGVHIVDDGKQFDRDQWERDKAKRDKQKEQELEEIKAKALPIKERDKGYRKIAHYLGLASSHRQDLLRRGLSEEQIADYPFFSADNYNRIPWDIPKNLPGVGIDRYSGDNCLIIKDSGYFCPSFDLNGQVNGGQIRYETENNKYRWPKGIVSSKLPNGELPLTFHKGKSDRNILNLVEGILKPLISGEKFGIEICGAAGGNFTASPNQFEEILTHNDYEKIVIHPDGGDILNPHVMQRWDRQISLIESLGLGDKLFIAWRRQINKSDGDLDEITLEEFNQIELITPRKFFEKAKFERRKNIVILTRIQEIQNKLRKLSYEPDIKLTKEDLIEGKYLPADLLVDLMPNEGIINLVSPKGTGKSYLNKKLIKKYRKQGKKIISITPRIVLGRGQAKDWGIEWIIEIDDTLLKTVNRFTIYENIETLGLCFDSIWKIAGRDFKNTVIILDESELGLNHLLSSSTCKEVRPKLLKIFENIIYETLANQGIVLLSDADLTDVSVNYIKSLAPENTPIFTIVNDVKPDSYTTLLLKQKKWLKQEMLNAIEGDEKIIIPTDSQTEAEKMDRELSERYPDKKIIRIDAKVTQTDYGKDFVERINESIKKEQPDILIHTSSMGTGTSIDGVINGEIDREVKYYFDKVFGIFLGVLPPSQCRQMLMRYRQPVVRYVYIKETGTIHGNPSFDPEEINRTLHEYHTEGLGMADILAMTQGLNSIEVAEKVLDMVNFQTGGWNNPHIEAYCQFKARNNYGLANLRELFMDELVEEGHRVTLIDMKQCPVNPKTKRYMEGEKEQGKAINKEISTGISTARTISLEQAMAISRKANATTAELHEAAKAFLTEELPGVELTPEFINENVVSDKRRKLNAIKLFWKLNNPDAAKYYDEKEYSHKFTQFAIHDTVYLPDIKAYSPLVSELLDLEILEVLANPDKEYTQDDPWLLGLKQKSLFRRGRLNDLCNVTVTKDSHPVHLANRLLAKIGLGLVGQRKRVNGERVWIYKLNLERLNDPDRLAILNALDLKWSQTKAKYGLEGVPKLAEKSIQNQGSFGTEDPVNTTPQVSECGTKDPKSTTNETIEVVAAVPEPVSIDEGTKTQETLGLKGVPKLAEKSIHNQGSFGTEDNLIELVKPTHFKLPMNRGFHQWCSFKYGDMIYDSRQMNPEPLWVIGSDLSEGHGLIVADESGIEIIPYRYGVLWVAQRVG